MLWVIFIAVLAFIMGLARGWKGIKSLRKAYTSQDVLIQWQEPPLSSPQERRQTLLVTCHSLAILALAILSVAASGSIWQAAPGRFPFVTQAILLGGEYFVWSFIGNIASQPLANLARLPLATGITAAGVYSGQHFKSWDDLSHFKASQQSAAIEIFSKNLPTLSLLTIQPSPADHSQVVRLLSEHLTQMPPASTLWMQRSASFVLFFLATGYLPLLVAFFLTSLDHPFAWIFSIMAIPLAALLGSMVVNAYQ